MSMIIKGATCFVGGEFRVCDIRVAQGKIVAIESQIEPTPSDEVICGEGQYLLPGLVDVHVHLREPGFERKETIKSGTAAAARGGVTTLFSMPNLSPVPDSVENLGVQLSAIKRDASVKVIPYASITLGQKGAGELVDFEALAPAVCGFSDDGRGVQSDELMLRAMQAAKSVGRPIVAHCEVNSLLEGGYIHKGDYCERNGHKGICSESEWAQVERDLSLVESADCQYHICHISTKESVCLLREAKAKGLKVSGETAPHYLLLTDEDLEENGRFKMNPPLRSAADQMELLSGVLDGTIECIATDHAPHTLDEKSRGLSHSAFGIVGIECSFALMYTYLVRRGVISLEKLIELMSLNARRLFGLESGEIEVGATADLVMFDLETKYTINPDDFLSMGSATPFEGWEVYGKTTLTLVEGKVAYRDKK